VGERIGKGKRSGGEDREREETPPVSAKDLRSC
jgi:hypothetical protein